MGKNCSAVLAAERRARIARSCLSQFKKSCHEMRGIIPKMRMIVLRITFILEQLREARFFSSLDLKDGY